MRETIDDISPIEDYTGHLAVQFGEFHFDDPVASIEECRVKDLTYSRPLTVTVAFVNRETGEIREQSVFMGRSGRSRRRWCPFLEHDDANRALMGSNMQRQAVPLRRRDRGAAPPRSAAAFGGRSTDLPPHH